MDSLSNDTTTSSTSPEQGTPQDTAPATPLTDRISDALQNAVKAVIGSNRKPPRRFRTLLNGTWLGHPLHPAITDVPIGAWRGGCRAHWHSRGACRRRDRAD